MLEVLSREFKIGLPMELRYADDLVLMAETEELLLERLRKWKKEMEAKGFRVNDGKTKVMQYRVTRVQSEDFGEHPYGVCRKGVVSTSILAIWVTHLVQVKQLECNNKLYCSTWPDE